MSMMNWSILLVGFAFYMSLDKVSTAAHPTSCIDVAKLLRSRLETPADGEYLLDVSPYYPASPLGPLLRRPVYCVDMSTCNPREYITLPAGPGQNFAYTDPRRKNEFVNDNCGNPYTGSGQTNFTKIRLELQSPLVVVRSDLLFTKSSGLSTQTYASGGDCYDYNPIGTAKGRFKVDITGTGFTIDSTVAWATEGHKAEIIAFSIDANRQMVSAFCGGHAGGCGPSGDLILDIDSHWTLAQYHNFTELLLADTGTAAETKEAKPNTPVTYTYHAAEAKTFPEAARICESEGGSLAVVTTAEISDIIKSACSGSECTSPVWIGATDRLHEGQYRWTTSHVLNYTGWCSDEPNGEANENCVEWLVDGNCWNDVSCAVTRKFICQSRPAHHPDYQCEKEDFSCLNADVENRELGCFPGTVVANKVRDDITEESACVSICRISNVFHCRSLIYENMTCYLFDQLISSSDYESECTDGRNGMYIQLAALENDADYTPAAGQIPTDTEVTLSAAATYSAAQAECNTSQSWLLTLNNKAKENHLLSILQDGEVVWIGLTDNEREAAWRWEDGTYAIYTNFEQNEPDGKTDSNCVIATKTISNDIHWSDDNCENRYKYLCESKLIVVATTQTPWSTENSTWCVETTSAQTQWRTATTLLTTTNTSGQSVALRSREVVDLTSPGSAAATDSSSIAIEKTTTADMRTSSVPAVTYTTTADMRTSSIPAATYTTADDASSSSFSTPTQSRITSAVDSSTTLKDTTVQAKIQARKGKYINWNLWTVWSKCSKTSLGGIHSRFRIHTNTNSSKRLLNLVNRFHDAPLGIEYEYENRECDVTPEVVWSAWSAWRKCSRSCGSGTSSRFRECYAPSSGNDSCFGRGKQHAWCSLTVYCERRPPLSDTSPAFKESDHITLNQIIGCTCWIPLMIICVCMVLSDIPTFSKQIHDINMENKARQ